MLPVYIATGAALGFVENALRKNDSLALGYAAIAIAVAAAIAWGVSAYIAHGRAAAVASGDAAQGGAAIG